VAYSTVSATTTMSFYMVYAAEKKLLKHGRQVSILLAEFRCAGVLSLPRCYPGNVPFFLPGS
jgi:hypothetical protein